MSIFLTYSYDRLSRGKRILQTWHGVCQSDSFGTCLEGSFSKVLCVSIVRCDLNDHRFGCVLDDPLCDLLDNDRILSASTPHTFLIHTMWARKVELVGIERSSVGIGDKLNPIILAEASHH